MATITSANAFYALSIATVFPAPVQLQGFATDDVFTTSVMKIIETMMGVDGTLSAGYVNVAVEQEIALQADSPSNAIFDQWRAAQAIVSDAFPASGTIRLPSLNQKWTLTRGFLTSWPPIPDARKLLQPRKYGITWEKIFASNI